MKVNRMNWVLGLLAFVASAALITSYDSRAHAEQPAAYTAEQQQAMVQSLIQRLRDQLSTSQIDAAQAHAQLDVEMKARAAVEARASGAESELAKINSDKAKASAKEPAKATE